MEQCNDIAFSVIEREMGIPKAVTAAESVQLLNVEPKIWLNYLEQVCDMFRGEIPHVKHPKLDLEKLREAKTAPPPDFSNLLKMKPRSKELEQRLKTNDDRSRHPRRTEIYTPSATPDGPAPAPAPVPVPVPVPSRRSRKRRSYEKFANNVSIAFWDCLCRCRE